MLIQTLQSLFTKDLNKLKTEIELYQNEKAIWTIEKNIANSAGNLCLHLVGNLNTFIGAVLGNTDYIRNRELEFSAKNIPREELTQMIEDTIAVVYISLDNLTAEQISSDYPLVVFESKTSTEFFLVHLASHLSYHLGQINYHRRLLDC
jgi:hypothetical protein